LSDAAFKLYAWLCLNVDRHTGQLQSTVPELSSALKKPESWTEPALRELVEQGVCWRMEADVLEVADRYWPYERQSRRHLVFAHDEILLAVHFDVAARVLPKQDAVAGFHVQWNHAAVLQTLTFSNGNDVAFLRFLLRGIGDDDSALYLFSLLNPSGHDPVI
jgi:hypothetical protein